MDADDERPHIGWFLHLHDLPPKLGCRRETYRDGFKGYSGIHSARDAEVARWFLNLAGIEGCIAGASLLGLRCHNLQLAF